MITYINLKCWERMRCNILNCPAKSEPKTPCWEIAKRIEAYSHVSNTCRDCIVYLLQKETSVLTNKEFQEILRNRWHSEKIGTGLLACTLKTATSE